MLHFEKCEVFILEVDRGDCSTNIDFLFLSDKYDPRVVGEKICAMIVFLFLSIEMHGDVEAAVADHSRGPPT